MKRFFLPLMAFALMAIFAIGCTDGIIDDPEKPDPDDISGQWKSTATMAPAFADSIKALTFTFFDLDNSFTLLKEYKNGQTATEDGQYTVGQKATNEEIYALTLTKNSTKLYEGIFELNFDVTPNEATISIVPATNGVEAPYPDGGFSSGTWGFDGVQVYKNIP
ncbi:MAG: hypothetical protein IPI59_04770 [Sphingobacteriales bacterium]|jgi:hypothetical protein|nr:hypothetical protein [Sphingobacteriales bacterium]MBK6891307.1 hypothetical protein [Sphingobacteriales bacterium]MBK7526862.1 hypothetical protein [Sphingobacteriales bacterium]MBL0248061.1 hypothetical protein [Sphingobacteriales bacterium]